MMYSKTHSLFGLIILLVLMQEGNSQPGFFQPPQQCENPNPNVQEQCLRNFCVTNQKEFVCTALKCKEEHVGDGIIEKLAKLKCIEGVCSLNRSEEVCQRLAECEAKKKTEGVFAFIGCIIELFSSE